MSIEETTNQAETAVSTPPTTQPRSFSWEAFAVVFLFLILALAAYFRFTGIDWDETYHLHPDERFLTDTTSLLRPVEDPLDYLRTSQSTLNPYNVGKTLYVYGNFPMTVTRYVGDWVNTLCTDLGWQCQYAYNTYNGFHIVGRVLSGLMDLVAIGFLFLLGRRLYNWRIGLLAALLHALAVMPIQQSHFYTMDNWAAGLTVMTLYTAVRAAGFGDNENRFRPGWYILFGMGLGLSMASRINVAPLGAMIGLAGLIWLARQGYELNTLAGLRTLLRGRGIIDLQRIILGGLLAVVFTLITFRLAQPYAFTDAGLAKQVSLEQTGSEPGALELFIRSLVGLNPQFSANMEEIQRLQAPEASFPPALQWTDRAAILFPLTNMILYGMSVTAAIAAWLGFAWALWRIATFRPDWTAHLIPVAWSGGYFLFIGIRWVKSIRYFLPIYPTLFLLAAWAVFTCVDMLLKRRDAQKRPSIGRVLASVLLVLLVVLPSFLWASSFVQIYQNPVTRVAASDWIFENVPSGATLLYEADGATHELNLPLKSFEFAQNGIPLTLNATMPQDGTITAIRFNYLSDPDYMAELADAETLRVRLDDGPFSQVNLNLTDQEEGVEIDLPDTAVSATTSLRITAEAGPGGLIRANTSILMNEHWDDLLPISTNGRNAYGSYYTEVTGGQRPVTSQDNDDKRREVLQWLDEADYIMISSQRAMWHLPRLPLVYPMMIKYYEWLFDGTLGFELVTEFHATHEIGSLYISDTGGTVSWGEAPEVGWPPPPEWAAEEAFSVYDHPPVWIFKKTDAYSHEQTAELLGNIDLSNPIFMNPQEATQAQDGLMLTAKEWLTQRANGTFRDIFAVDSALNQSPTLAAVVWWLTVIALGWLAFPILFVVLRGLPDRGYALARIFALLFVSYFGWILASYDVLPNTRGTLLLGTAVMGILSLILFLRHRHDIAAWVSANLAYIGIAEAVGIGLYLLMIGIRLGNPDVWDVIWGGEKPMDLSYFTAVLKSTTFPPYDPWYAGGYINYYYYGFVYVGSITKLLGVIPALAYNLILPMLYSFTGLGVFSIAYNLVESKDWQAAIEQSPIANLQTRLNKRAISAGLIATLLAVFLGNLAEVGVLTNAWYKAGNDALGSIPLVGNIMQTLDGGIKVLSGQPAPIYPSDWFWNASRAINANPGEVAPITEFPFFTFLYGDL
ncbi:MAG: glycosyltransferase family 39 protein, partial [Anaerolineales bacterium]|nr:glycosyltransferase family 39 protein [Anaerolineales bacterium]